MVQLFCVVLKKWCNKKHGNVCVARSIQRPENILEANVACLIELWLCFVNMKTLKTITNK